VTNPVDMARTRLQVLQLQRRRHCAVTLAQVQGELHMSASKYRGVLHCLHTVARHEGILGLQKGLVAGVLPYSHDSHNEVNAAHACARHELPAHNERHAARAARPREADAGRV
jgi:hypothetical protein